MNTENIKELPIKEQFDILFLQYPEDKIAEYEKFTDPEQNKVDFGTLPITLQKEENIIFALADTIVIFHSGLLFGKNTTFDILKDENKVFPKFNEYVQTSKANSLNFLLANTTLKYGLSAEIISFNKEKDKFNITICDPTKEKIGYNFDNGDLTLFVREYKYQIIEDGEVKDALIVEYYEDKKMTKYIQINANQDFVEYGNVWVYDKMPVVLYICTPIWLKVKNLIDRINRTNTANAYIINAYSFPILVMIGDLLSFDDKEKLDAFQKKINSLGITKQIVVETENTGGQSIKGDVKYLQPSVESMLFDKENTMLLERIFADTGVTNITIETIQKIGNLSGRAIELLFLNSKILNNSMQSIFFHLDRRWNIMKNQLDYFGNTLPTKKYQSLIVETIFNSPLPSDKTELTDNVINQKNSKLLSTEGAQESLGIDTEVEGERLEDEKEIENQSIINNLGETFNY